MAKKNNSKRFTPWTVKAKRSESTGSVTTFDFQQRLGFKSQNFKWTTGLVSHTGVQFKLFSCCSCSCGALHANMYVTPKLPQLKLRACQVCRSCYFLNACHRCLVNGVSALRWVMVSRSCSPCFATVTFSCSPMLPLRRCLVLMWFSALNQRFLPSIF